ncbi:DUF2273 domain-containing protein [Peptococcaceae bacterium]|nr:DUF2273 domain-containing protein [Peptococcaceae bacterium]
MDYKYFLQVLYNHKGKVLGLVLGLLFGWFAINYGVFKTLFIAACMAVGYFLGKHIDEKVDIKETFDRFFKQ